MFDVWIVWGVEYGCCYNNLCMIILQDLWLTVIFCPFSFFSFLKLIFNNIIHYEYLQLRQDIPKTTTQEQTQIQKENKQNKTQCSIWKISFPLQFSTSVYRSMSFSSTTKSLGFIFDQYMTFDHHVNKLVQSCFLQLRNIVKIRCIFSSMDLKLLIHTFIFSRIDYCNSLYTCLSQDALNHLQLVQNAAGSIRRSHITPVHTRPCMTLPPVTLLIFLFPLINHFVPQISTFYPTAK